MIREAVAGVPDVESPHDCVALDFRQDRRSSDAGGFGVAFDDGLLGEVDIFQPLRVDQQVLRRQFQSPDCTLHGLDARPIDVNPVDLLDLHERHTPTFCLYSELERLKQEEDVKVVYIVLPNSMHKEFVLRTAAIGKHVLCEKPMATSALDAQEMIEACKSANVKLMIAYRCRYEPHHLEVIRQAQSGGFGQVKLIEPSTLKTRVTPSNGDCARRSQGEDLCRMLASTV
jgi:hypothetical protein